MTTQTTNPVSPRRASSRGFTLIELMITVAIVAILGTIATAAYTSEVRKSRRTDARSALLDLAGREEKLFSVTNAYSVTPSELGYTGALPITVGSGYYQISAIVSPDPAQPAMSSSYVITATAIGLQASDTQCATLSINSAGQQLSTGSATASTCWGN
jgi:type IV pilus assembly protein PilE